MLHSVTKSENLSGNIIIIYLYVCCCCAWLIFEGFFYKDLGLKNLFLQKENPFLTKKKMELFKTYNATYLGFGKNARCADCLLT